MASNEKVDSDKQYFAASLTELKQSGKKRVILENGRVIVLFFVKGQVHALDHFCYRK